jgi:hypothetical protein
VTCPGSYCYSSHPGVWDDAFERQLCVVVICLQEYFAINCQPLGKVHPHLTNYFEIGKISYSTNLSYVRLLGHCKQILSMPTFEYFCSIVHSGLIAVGTDSLA